MEKSTFDLEYQNSNIESKIVASLEKIAQAFRVLLWDESKELALTPIQVQVLIFLLYHSSQQRKVSYLATEFNMTKATISETIKTLEKKQLIKRVSEQHDSRSFIIHLTEKGESLAQKTSFFTKQLQEPIGNLPSSDKENLLLSLLEIIQNLNKSGIISIQRMCFSCQFYKANNNGQEHFCNLLNTKLADTEIRIDCPEHKAIAK